MYRLAIGSNVVEVSGGISSHLDKGDPKPSFVLGQRIGGSYLDFGVGSEDADEKSVFRAFFDVTEPGFLPWERDLFIVFLPEFCYVVDVHERKVVNAYPAVLWINGVVPRDGYFVIFNELNIVAANEREVVWNASLPDIVDNYKFSGNFLDLKLWDSDRRVLLNLETGEFLK